VDPAVDTTLRIVAIGLAFGLTVFVHEAGHFIAARLARMAVYEFSIGVGRPLLFWFRPRDTQYSFRLWPFLSYVRIAGMEPEDEHPQGFGKRKRIVQAAVLLSGCMMNFLLAALVYMVMGAAMGLPVPTNRIESVMPGSAAARAGLMPGDRVMGVGGRVGLSVEEIREVIQSHPGRPLVFRVDRNGQVRRLTVTPSKETVYDVKGLVLVKVTIGRIGIGFGSRTERMGVGRSVLAGFVETFGAIRLQIAGWVGMAMRTIPPDLMGPVGIAQVLYTESKANWLQFLSVSAMLTVAIGFVNLLPIPALDGSRLLIVAIEAIRRKPFDKRKEAVVHLVGLALLLFLGAIIAYRDILRVLRVRGG